MLLVLLACAALPWLNGCGSTDNPQAATRSYNAKARKAHQPAEPSRPGAEDLADMVAAASATKTGPPVEMKFALQQRPEVGQPMDVSIAMIPRSATLDSLSASFEASEGLEVVGGAEMPRSDKPVLGTPLRHMVRILPKREGIFAVTVTVNVDSANTRATRTFSIPVIAGDGSPGPAAASEAGASKPAARPEATKG
ncbi:MAG TPA: hypothetical protein VFO44_03990 [Steroidobacteraceae bacterium]|nr:hypothetical protein [Steroidobacteraceae bacterium]